MGQLQFARPRRQPLVVLSLLFNVLLLGGSMLVWSGGGLMLGLSQQPRGGRGPQQGPAGFQACERAELNETLLEEWGCTVFEKACFDQEHMLLHDGRKTPDSPTFTPDPLFSPHNVPPYVLPGYDEPLGTPHYSPKSWDVEIRGPTPLDPPDVGQPAEFSNCTVPLVWWLTYFSVFGDLYIGAALALDAMLAEGAVDRNVTLAPVTLGLDLPPWYQLLLDPYTRHQVRSLASLSSREHIRTGQPRCFERAIMCNMVGLYVHRARRHWTQLRPKTTGRRAVEHYRRLHPEVFARAEAAAAKEKDVLRVAFMPRARLRQIVNLKEAMQECKQWVPPQDSRFKRVECVALPDGSPDTFVELLAALQHVHALVNTHGSGNNFAFFMPPGTALVEILPWNFHGVGCTWADQYFSDWFLLDHTVESGYFRLVADKDHVFPGQYEKEQRGSSIAYGRDQDVALDFPTLARALEKVARGQLETNHGNHEERTFFMTRRDLCPTSREAIQEENERKQQEAANVERQQADLASQFETKPGGEAGEAAEKEAGEAGEKAAEVAGHEGQPADGQAAVAGGADGGAALAAAGDQQGSSAAAAEAAQPGGEGTQAEAKAENEPSRQ